VAGAATLAHAQADFASARALYQESEWAFRAAGDEPGRAGVLAMLGSLARNQADYAAARRCYDECLALVRDLGERSTLASVLTGLGQMAAEEGRAEEATGLLEGALALARDRGADRPAARALDALSAVARRRGDLARARALGEQALLLRAHTGALAAVAESLSGLAAVRRAEGDGPGAGALYAAAVRLAWAFGDRLTLAASLEGMALLAVAGGEPDRALRLGGAAAGLRLAIAAPPPPASQAEVVDGLRPAWAARPGLSGRARWMQGQVMPLERAVVEALDPWSGPSAPPPPLPGAVRTLLSTRPAWASEGAGAVRPPDVTPADVAVLPALPAAVSGAQPGRAAHSGAAPPAWPAAGIDRLTDRQLEVLALLTAGATSAVVAERLQISGHTVRRHVAGILRKLGVASRGAAVVLALGLDGPPGRPGPALHRLDRLSGREREVLLVLASGTSNVGVAARLGLSVHTVRHHVTSILRKLEASTRGEAVARVLGLSPRPEGGPGSNGPSAGAQEWLLAAMRHGGSLATVEAIRGAGQGYVPAVGADEATGEGAT
jgi:DNA-binding CsgD family transcriptional regulator/tetratricopeptide (TPR) repeat protein